jgi:hypothetical protein
MNIDRSLNRIVQTCFSPTSTPTYCTPTHCVLCGLSVVCCSPVLAYGSQAQSLFGGAGVVAATADVTSGSPGAVLVAAGGSLFRVTVAGAVSLVGVIQDSATGFSRVVPSGLTFVGRNTQCGAAAAGVAQGEVQHRAHGGYAL